MTQILRWSSIASDDYMMPSQTQDYIQNFQIYCSGHYQSPIITVLQTVFLHWFFFFLVKFSHFHPLPFDSPLVAKGKCLVILKIQLQITTGKQKENITFLVTIEAWLKDQTSKEGWRGEGWRMQREPFSPFKNKVISLVKTEWGRGGPFVWHL